MCSQLFRLSGRSPLAKSYLYFSMRTNDFAPKYYFMEITTPASVNGLQNCESKTSSETLVTLSIIQLIRFFDSFELRNDPPEAVNETSKNPLKEEHRKGEGIEEEEENIGNGVSFFARKGNVNQKVPSLVSSATSNVNSSITCGVPIDSGSAEENFRPRESKIADSNIIEMPHVKTSGSFSIGSFYARQLFLRSTSAFFTGKKREQKEQPLPETDQKDHLFPMSPVSPPAPSIQKPGRARMNLLANRMSSTLFTRKHDSFTQLENRVFLPKTHRPLPQNYPTVEDVEDIADARTEYSVLPEEWSEYMDPMMKSSGNSGGEKSRWKWWHFPNFRMKTLGRKLKSSLASGARKTHTFRVRFLAPYQSVEPEALFRQQGDEEEEDHH